MKNHAIDIILLLILIGLLIATFLLINNQRYDTAIATIAIIASIISPYCTKNLELEKHRRQFLYEKKYNAYSKYFKMLDKFWDISSETILNMHFFATQEHKSKEEFEAQKSQVINLYKKFCKIKNYLSRPELELLIFVNKNIETKIKEIIQIDTNKNMIIDHENDLQKNMQIIESYIEKLNELPSLLQKDLEID